MVELTVKVLREALKSKRIKYLYKLRKAELLELYKVHCLIKKSPIHAVGFKSSRPMAEIQNDDVVAKLNPREKTDKAQKFIADFKKQRPVNTPNYDAYINTFRSKNKALIAAAENGHLDVVQELLNRGAKSDTKQDYPLLTAAYFGHLDVVKALVDYGAHVHAHDCAALRLASHAGHLDVVNYLIKQGCRSNV